MSFIYQVDALKQVLNRQHLRQRGLFVLFLCLFKPCFLHGRVNEPLVYFREGLHSHDSGVSLLPLRPGVNRHEIVMILILLGSISDFQTSGHEWHLLSAKFKPVSVDF